MAKVLEERRLKISRIHELNDPFEFLAQICRAGILDGYERDERELSKTTGCLFSKDWKTVLCLTMQIITEGSADSMFLMITRKVDYVKERLDYGHTIDFETMRSF